MLPYIETPVKIISFQGKEIASFVKEKDAHTHTETINSFGEEWQKFNLFTDEEIQHIGNEYFDVVKLSDLTKEMVALDLGCGSGRWSRFLADKVGFIEALDPSEAVYSAVKLTQDKKNVRVTQAGVDNIPFADQSFDFIICLGVLHHLPHTEMALAKAVKKLKKNGLFLLYLYYNLENRNFLFRLIFTTANLLRTIISKMPSSLKHFLCEVIAVLIYIPFIIVAKCMKVFFPNKNYYKKIPLSYYLGKSFTVIRNDALDRFGTPLEQRFSKEEIKVMMENVGLGELTFSPNEPYWHVIGKRIN
ncbi:MAG: class I SAM-dependent methyltransferase [Bacteroidetes bacterium]|nr:class I SAM-dependent methyltransferase [Bacteroidota bacterium]